MTDNRIMYIKTVDHLPILVAIYPTQEHMPPSIERNAESGAFTYDDFLKYRPYLNSPLVREVALDAGWLRAGVVPH